MNSLSLDVEPGFSKRKSAKVAPVQLRFESVTQTYVPARALREKESLMKRFDVGARVTEPTYGLGSVIAVEDAYTRVQFDEHGVKIFAVSDATLWPVNT